MWDEGPYAVDAWYCRGCGISLPASGPAYFQYGPAPVYCWKCRGDEKPVNIDSAFKSNYLKTADLGGKNVIVTMDRVVIETLGQGRDQESKPVLYFKGHERGLVLNITNKNTIVEIVGSNETDAWVGHRIVLYPDKTEMGGKRVDCIRIRRVPQGQQPVAPPPPPPPTSEFAESFSGTDDEPPF